MAEYDFSGYTNGDTLQDIDTNFADGGNYQHEPFEVDANGNLYSTETSLYSGFILSGSGSDICRVVLSAGASSDVRYPMVRASTTTTGYHVKLAGYSAGNYTTCVLYKNGAYQDEASGSWSASSPITVVLECSGTTTTTVTVTINDTLELTLNDSSSPITSGDPGMYVYPDATAIETSIDLFADALASSGATVTTNTASITYTIYAATITTSTKSVDSVTGTVAPNEQITVNCTGFGTVTSITLGGESLTIDAQNNGNPICTISSDINLKWGQSYDLVVTDITGAEQLNTTLQARAGWEIVEWVGPAPDTGATESFYEEAIEDFSITAGAGDQLQHTTAANMTVDGQWIPTVSPAGARSGTYAVWDESASTRSSEAAWSIVINASITTTTPSITYTPVAATVTAATILQTNTRSIIYSPFNATVGNENVISTTTPSISYSTSSATVSSIAGLVTNRASIRYTANPATVSSPSVWTEIPRSSTTWTEV